MTDQELYDIVSRWYGEYVITPLDFQRLKVRYLQEQGFDPSKCTTCPDFPSEVQHYYRVYLKSIGLTVMSSNRKYILAPNVGSIRMSGEGESLTNANLTNERAEGILSVMPEMAENIIDNPDYVAPTPTAKKKDETKGGE